VNAEQTEGLRVARRAGIVPEFDVFDQAVRVAIVRQLGATLEVVRGACDLERVAMLIDANTRQARRGGLQ
jgi:hypothetical protein